MPERTQSVPRVFTALIVDAARAVVQQVTRRHLEPSDLATLHMSRS